MVCTKAQDAEAAILANAQHLSGIPVVIVQNGLDGLDTARSLLPDSRRIGAIAVFAAERPAPGRVAVVTPGPCMWEMGLRDPLQRRVETARILSSAIPSKAVGNFTGHQWTKLIVNQANSMPAITGRSVQETLGRRDLRRITAASIREAARVGLQQGVRFGRMNVLGHTTPRILASAPVGGPGCSSPSCVGGWARRPSRDRRCRASGRGTPPRWTTSTALLSAAQRLSAARRLSTHRLQHWCTRWSGPAASSPRPRSSNALACWLAGPSCARPAFLTWHSLSVWHRLAADGRSHRGPLVTGLGPDR